MKKKLNHTDKGQAAGSDGTRAKPAAVDDAAEAKRGEREGLHWAMCTATAPQLSLFAAVGTQFIEVFENPRDEAVPNGFDVEIAVLVKYGYDAADACTPAFIQSGRKYSRPYMAGFVRAAIDVWRKCQEPIERPAQHVQ